VVEGTSEKAVRRTNRTSHSEHVIDPRSNDHQFSCTWIDSHLHWRQYIPSGHKERTDARGETPFTRPLGFNSQTFNKTEQHYRI